MVPLPLALFWIAACNIFVRAFHEGSVTTVPNELFEELDELSRLVAISYCVGFQGIQEPFSCLSYCSDFPGLELVQTHTGITTASCGYYIALSHAPRYPPRILVLFRGTSSLADFLSDLQSTHADYVPYATTNGWTCSNCTVHAGFMASWNATREAMMPQLQVLHHKYPDYKVVLAGHSLGGAVAGLAGIELTIDGSWRDLKVVTFGQPMFGNVGMANFVTDIFNCSSGNNHDACFYRRVTHIDDPVPLLPPAEWGWRQHAGEVYISKVGLPPSLEDLVLCKGIEDIRCSSGKSDQRTGGAGAEFEQARTFVNTQAITMSSAQEKLHVTAQWQIWQLLFAHREYFRRLGLCFDPSLPWDGVRLPAVSEYGQEL